MQTDFNLQFTFNLALLLNRHPSGSRDSPVSPCRTILLQTNQLSKPTHPGIQPLTGFEGYPKESKLTIDCQSISLCISISKSENPRRSVLFRTIADERRNIAGYFIGLSSPSVVLINTTFISSPRSYADGQTRFPTFSMKSISISSSFTSFSAFFTIAASR